MGTSGTANPVSVLKLARLLILGIGPILSWQILHSVGSLTQGDLRAAEAVLFLAWSPLFFSIPALLCQTERDAALPSMRGPWGSFKRAIALVPYLLLSKSSTLRLETAVSLAMWALLGLIVTPSLAYWVAGAYPF